MERSGIGLFRDLQCITDFDAQVAYGALADEKRDLRGGQKRAALEAHRLGARSTSSGTLRAFFAIASPEWRRPAGRDADARALDCIRVSTPDGGHRRLRLRLTQPRRHEEAMAPVTVEAARGDG